ENGDKTSLAKLDAQRPYLGYTLIVLLDQGRVLELNAQNHARFQIDNLELPLDAQMLPGERVLVAEHNGNRVTERNRKGEILWKTEVSGPIMAQRLANGNTFIATRTELIEVNREGKAVREPLVRQNGEQFMKAIKLRNGDIACMTSMGHFLKLNSE